MKRKSKGTGIDVDTRVNTPLAVSALVFFAVLAMLVLQMSVFEGVQNSVAAELGDSPR